MSKSIQSQGLGPGPGGGGPGPETAGAPSLLEQITGLCTGPVPLFRRLARTPRWGWALVALMALSMLMILVWAAKVDADALLRPALARDPRIAEALLDKTIEVQGRLLGLFGALGVLLGQPALSLFLALVYWLVGRVSAAGPRPSYRHALSAAVVPSLVVLPKLLLVSVLCLVRPVRGLLPDQISPFSLGALFEPGTGKLEAHLSSLDLFEAASLVLLFLAARHLLRLKRSGALACTAAAAAVTVGLHLLYAS